MFLMILGLTSFKSFSQIVTTLGNPSVTSSGNISVPLIVNNFSNVAAVTINVQYNPNVLTYVSNTANPAISVGLITNGVAPAFVSVPGYRKFAAVWTDPNNGLSPISLPNGSILFTLNFTSAGGTSPLFFEPSGSGNEYADGNADILPVNFISGSVTINNTYNGGTSSFMTPTNWSTGFVPTNNSNVVIPATATSLSLASSVVALAKNFTINAGATVTVQPGAAISIGNGGPLQNLGFGSLVNNGTLNIQDGGSLVQAVNTTVSGSGVFNVARSGSASAFKYNFWSSPVVGQTLDFGTASDRYRYDPTFAVNNINLGFQPASNAPMMAGRGFAVTNGGNKTFTGVPHNGPYSVSALAINQGFNLVGNPYASAISIASFFTANPSIVGSAYIFFDNGSPVFNSNTSAEYITTNSAGSVVTPSITGLANLNGNIGTAQGFMIKTNANATVNFTNAMRVATANNLFRTAPIAGFRLAINGPSNIYNETLVTFMDDATDAIDNAFDSPKLKSGSLALYTMNATDALAIQALSPVTTVNKEVIIGLDAPIAGTYTFNAKAFENLAADFKVTLVDLATGVSHNFNNNANYVFSTVAGSSASRFKLVFSTNSTSSVAELASATFNAYVNADLLYINGANSAVKSVKVVDMLGRTIQTWNNLNTKENLTLNLSKELTNGNYLVQIVTENGVSSKKINALN